MHVGLSLVTAAESKPRKRITEVGVLLTMMPKKTCCNPLVMSSKLLVLIASRMFFLTKLGISFLNALRSLHYIALDHAFMCLM